MQGANMNAECDGCGTPVGASTQYILGEDGRIECCEQCEPERVLAAHLRVAKAKKPTTYRLQVTTENRSSNPEWQVYRVRFVGEPPADAPQGSEGIFGLVGAVGSQFPTRAVIAVAGQWARHERFGLQLKALGRATYCVEDRKGFVSFCESVGYSTPTQSHPTLATQSLLDAVDFDALLSALAKQPEERKLDLDEKAYNLDWLSEQFRRYVGFREAYDFLASVGIEHESAAIVDALGEATVDVVRDDCFLLTELPGARVSMRRATTIADALKYSTQDPRRVGAMILDCIESANSAGHTRVRLDALFDARDDSTRSFEQLHKLGLSHDVILDGLERIHEREDIYIGSQLLVRQRLVIEGEYVYAKRHHRAETNIAERLVAMAKRSPRVVDAENAKWAFDPTDEQREGVRIALSKQLCVLTGGPGVGKTTVTKTILSSWLSAGETILCLAPTARAAKRMTEATGFPAMTIHRAVMTANAKKEQLDASAIVVDECSMVDNLLMDRFLAHVPGGARLLLVGDVDQLPSVGAGRVLHDIVSSDVVPVVRLTRMMRSVEDGNTKRIPQTARDILEGRIFDTSLRGSDVNFLEINSLDDIETAACRAFTEWMPKKYGYSAEDILVLSPQRGDIRKENYKIGVNGLNGKLQALANPSREDEHEYKVRHGVVRMRDRVRHTKNDYDLGAYNGDVGVVEKLSQREFEPESDVQSTSSRVVLVVDYGDKKVGYTKGQLSMLDLAYAGTVHSSQGSEAPAVIIIVHSSFAWTQTRNLIYTAHTRARKNVLYIGQRAALEKAINTTRDEKRETGLAEKLRNEANFAS